MHDKKSLSQIFETHIQAQESSASQKALQAFFTAMDNVRAVLSGQDIPLTVDLHPVGTEKNNVMHDLGGVYGKPLYQGTAKIGETLSFPVTLFGGFKGEYGVKLGTVSAKNFTNDDTIGTVQEHLVQHAARYVAVRQGNQTKKRHLDRRHGR